jgi:hypothetical protein
MTLSTFLACYVLVSSVVVIAAIVSGTRAAVARAGWPAPERRAAVATTALVLVGWFALAAVLAWSDAFRGAADRLPTIQYGLALPVIAGIVLMWRSPGVARLIGAIPTEWLVGVQLYRALGAIFLLLFYVTGEMPGAFAWPASVGDFVTGVLAPVVAVAYARNPQANARRVLGWNLFGLADLAVAITMGFLTAPSPFQAFALDTPNSLISSFPLVLIPAFLVPLSILLHIASLTKLRAEMPRAVWCPQASPA